MKKMDRKIIFELISIIIIFFVCVFCVISFSVSYYNYKKIADSNLNNYSYIEGNITSIKEYKKKLSIKIDSSKYEYEISIEYKEELDLNESDNLIIYYTNPNLFFQGSYHIINLNKNGTEVFTKDQYIKSSDLTNKRLLIVLSSVLSVIFLGVGLLSIFRKKPTISKSSISSRKKLIEGRKENLQREEINGKKFEDLYEMFKNSIYKSNGKTFTSGLELVEHEDYGDIFFKSMADLVEEKELLVIYDDVYKDNSVIYVVDKINQKSIILNLFKEEGEEFFYINNETLYFWLDEEDPTQEEVNTFIKQIKNYNEFEEKIFLIEQDL